MPLADVVRRWRERAQESPLLEQAIRALPPSLGGELDRVVAASEFAAAALLQDPAALTAALLQDDAAAAAALNREGLLSVARCGNDEPAALRALRNWRRRAMLRIAWRDIAGRAGVDETLHELSDLADACIGAAAEAATRHLQPLFGLPRTAEVVPVDFPGMIDRLSYVFLISPIVAWLLWPRRLVNKTDILLILLTALLTGLTWQQGRWSYYASLTGLFLLVRYCQTPRPAEGAALTVAGGIDRIILIVLSVPFLYWCSLIGASPNGGDLLLILLILALVALALLPNEWAGYFSIGNPLSDEGVGPLTPNFWMRIIIVAVLFIGSTRNDSEQVSNHGKVPPIQPSLQLVQISRAIDEPGAILAPWWLSPGLLYFSGHPVVSGSSHEGMSGIVASAKFFSTTSWPEAEKILDQRKVRWVVVWDDSNLVYPVLGNSQRILGLPRASDDDPGDAEQTVAQMLIEDRIVPTALQLRGVVEERQLGQKFKLYEYTPGG